MRSSYLVVGRQGEKWDNHTWLSGDRVKHEKIIPGCQETGWNMRTSYLVVRRQVEVVRRQCETLEHHTWLSGDRVKHENIIPGCRETGWNMRTSYLVVRRQGETWEHHTWLSGNRVNEKRTISNAYQIPPAGQWWKLVSRIQRPYKMAKLFNQKKFFWHDTPSRTCSIYLYC